jgi:quinol-cytochrome oxidoreductase complex cytochrome b subunit
MSIHQVPVPADAVASDGSSTLGLPTRIWRSIFRSPPLPATELQRSQSVAANFFFHIHAAKVNERTLKFSTTMGLGLITFFMFIILCITGVFLMFYYVPSAEQAYQRMLDLRGAVVFGSFLRALHRWTAHGMVLFVGLHMVRVFLTGAHKAPREFNWVIGIFLLLLTAFLAYWAIMIGSTIATYAPVVGNDMRFLMLGDDNIGGEAILRFYVAHVMVLPIVVTTLIGIHFWRIRKDGGLARPDQG